MHAFKHTREATCEATCTYVSEIKKKKIATTGIFAYTGGIARNAQV